MSKEIWPLKGDPRLNILPNSSEEPLRTVFQKQGESG